jgi:hypothetical protein
MANSVEAGRAFMRLTLNDASFRKGIDAAGRRLQSFGSTALRIGGAFTGLGAAITAPFVGAVSAFIKTGDELDKMAARTGISEAALSELGFAAEQSGAQLGDVEKGVRGLQKTLLNASRGLSTSVDSLAEIGLSFEDLEGKLPEEQFTIVADRLAAIEDPSKRVALSMQLLGRSGSSLQPLLGSVAALRQEARDLGIVIGTDTANAAARLADAFNRVRRQVGATFVFIGSALEPVLTRVADALTLIGRSVIQWVRNNQQLVATVATVGAVIASAGTLFVGFGIGLTIAGFALSGFASLLGVVGVAISAIASPLGIAVAAFVGLGTAILLYTDLGAKAIEALRATFGPLLSTVTETIEGVRDAIAGGNLELAGRVAMAGLRAAWAAGVSAVVNIWTGFQSIVVSVAQGIANVMTVVASTISSAFILAFGHIKRAFFEAQAFITNGVLNIVKYVYETLTGQPFDISVEVDNAQQKLDAQRAAVQAGVDQQILAIESVENRVAQGINNLADSRRERLADQATAAQEEARRLSEELLSVREEAAVSRAVAEAASKSKAVAPAITDTSEVARQSARSLGTFSTLTAGAQVGSSKIETLTKQQLTKLDRIERLLDRNLSRPAGIAVT